MLRRMLAITLMIAFGSPLVLPLFAATADPESSLPACCRSHGAHHCTMVHMQTASNAPAFSAPPCPVYPAASTPPGFASALLAAPLRLVAEQPGNPVISAANPHRPRTFRVSANLKRGPPTLSA